MEAGLQNEADNAVQQAVEAQNPGDYEAMMAVVSGDSDGGDLSDEDIISLSDNPQSHSHKIQHDDPDTANSGDELYDENLDAEDEAYVFNNLRGGQVETDWAAQRDDGKIDKTVPVKPRNSDAVLSCPCCFNIVCMDCQRHERYRNQYRAMFVMSVEVDWQHQLKYDDKLQGLVRYNPNTQQSLPNGSPGSQVVAPDHNSDDPIYYAVSCASCHTMVAALDMVDEVYHFYDCLAST